MPIATLSLINQPMEGLKDIPKLLLVVVDVLIEVMKSGA